MENKMVRVPFDVEMAKKITNGEIEGRVVTREGDSVRILCWDKKDKTYHLAALVDDGLEENYRSYTNEGIWNTDETCTLKKYDLMLEIPEYMTFKDGDVIAYDGFDTISITMADVIRNVNDVFAHYYAELRNGKLHFYEEDERDVLNVGARLATESEKQKLIEALKESKEPKAKECLKMLGIEIKPKCEFKPFDKVLVRDYDDGVWKPDIFFNNSDGCNYMCTGNVVWAQCIPYNDQTAHLLGTTDNWEE